MKDTRLRNKPWATHLIQLLAHTAVGETEVGGDVVFNETVVMFAVVIGRRVKEETVHVVRCQNLDWAEMLKPRFTNAG